jgi:hypothetical protein
LVAGMIAAISSPPYRNVRSPGRLKLVRRAVAIRRRHSSLAGCPPLTVDQPLSNAPKCPVYIVATDVAG